MDGEFPVIRRIVRELVLATIDPDDELDMEQVLELSSDVEVFLNVKLGDPVSRLSSRTLAGDFLWEYVQRNGGPPRANSEGCEATTNQYPRGESSFAPVQAMGFEASAEPIGNKDAGIGPPTPTISESTKRSQTLDVVDVEPPRRSLRVL
jgi:hypothetical protein